METPLHPSKEPDPPNLEDHNSSLPDVLEDNLLNNDKKEPVSIQQSDLSRVVVIILVGVNYLIIINIF